MPIDNESNQETTSEMLVRANERLRAEFAKVCKQRSDARALVLAAQDDLRERRITPDEFPEVLAELQRVLS